jgi:hypothetical protein
MLPSFLIISWLLATASRLGWHGDVYSFNFAIFQPDGIFYSFKSLMFLGIDSTEAAVRVCQWFSAYSGTGETFNPEFFLSTWGTYPSERTLYPLLSTPFVALLGLNGMLVIPAISLLILQLNIYLLGKKLHQSYLGLGIAILLTFSPTVTRWMISSLPDSLLVALISFFPIILINNKFKYRDLLLVSLTIACSFTRFSLPILLSMSIIFCLQKKFKIAMILLSSSLICSIPALINVNSAFMPRSSGSMLSKFLSLPVTFLKVGFIEMAQLAVLDRLLLTIVIIAFVLAVKFRKLESSQFFLANLAAVWTLGTLNATLGVNFRYELPILIFCCWVILENLPKFFMIANTHIKIEEIKE